MFDQAAGVGNGQASLACYSPWDHRINSVMLNSTDSDSCEEISHCSFDLHFSNNEQC